MHARRIAIVAGTLFAVGQLAVYLATRGQSIAEFAPTGFYRASCVLLLAGFIGLVFTAFALHSRLPDQGTVTGRIGLAGAVTGTVLMAGDWWFETFAVPFYAQKLPQLLEVPGGGGLAAGGLASYVTFALGWALLGFACLRTGLVGKAVGFTLIAAGLLGYGAVAPPSGLALGVALVWAGLTLRNRASDPALQASPS